MEQAYEGKVFKHVVILGDSVSDIGRMRSRAVSSLPGVILNDSGRFSDARNWVDYFWQHVTNESLFDPRSASQTIANSSSCLRLREGGDSPRSSLAVYAEGGAIGWNGSEGITDNSFAKTCILSDLESQVAEYKTDRSARAPSGKTLCIIWIGANDVVTVKREPRSLSRVATEIVARAGELINASTHVMIIDVPDPQFMPRFAKDEGIRKGFADAAEALNTSLDVAVRGFNSSHSTPLHLFRISALATPISMRALGVAPFAQPKGSLPGATVSAEAAEGFSLLRCKDLRVTAETRYATTCDQLHPTEVVYEFLAGLIIDYVEQNFSFDGYRAI